MKNWQIEAKVGLFAALILGLIAFMSIKVSEGPLLFGGGYDVTVTLETAVGIDERTPVEIAGISVGQVKKVKLADDGRRAIAILRIERKNLKLPEHTKAIVRAKGFLGDTYIELIPGPAGGPILQDGAQLEFGGVGGDVNMLITRFNDIADDVKIVAKSLKETIGDKDSPYRQTMGNMQEFSEAMRKLIEQNQQNVNEMTENFVMVSRQLRDLIGGEQSDVAQSMSRIASISRKIDEGQGTIGRLVNDDETVEKVNDALDSLNDTLGGFRRLETVIGYHSEYLGTSQEFKHYVHLDLWPRPDQAFMFEFVEDRSPPIDQVRRVTEVTTGGTTTTVLSETQTQDRTKFLVSAQLAKKFYDFILRGGIIESRGGLGVDYVKGPVGLSFSAFDFNTDNGNKPHLKISGKLNVTPSLYVVGGADDPLNPRQSTDWFVGAGVQLRDDDIKSLLGSIGLGTALRQ